MSAVLRDRWVGGGTGGSWHVPVDIDESSAEDSANELSLGPRESVTVSTGRSAAGSESLEVKVCPVIPQGRRTPEDVR